MVLLAIARFFVRLAFELVLGIAYRLSGANKSPPGKPARVWTIRYRSRAFDVGVAGSADFWCTHSRYESSECVLEEGVTLYSLNAEYAYFVKCPPNVVLTDAHAFYYSAQFLNANQMIQVPIAEFHRMAQKVGDPQGEMVYLFSTGRCGSTLFQQMMSAFPRTVSLSEPDSFTCVHALKNKGVSPTELKTIMQSVVRLEGKRCGKGHRLVIKTRSQCTWQANMISELFPNAHFLFMYRNAIDVAFSNIRAFLHLPGLGLAFNESIPLWLRDRVISAPLKAFMTKTAAHIYPLEYLKTLSVLCLVVTGWVVECLCYLELRERGVKINAIRYENLIANSEGTFRAVSKYLDADLTPEILGLALDEMKKDSQENSSFGTASQSNTKFTAADRQALVEVLARKNLAPDAILDGTLTAEASQ
jgi:hypothetical protein